ncbi:MAG: glycosyltransferase family 4 protein [Gemmatimonadota bacterium]
MRVALVCDWFLPRMGGIELHLRDLAVALCASGVDARIVTTTPGAECVDGVRVHRVPGSLMPGAGIAYTPGPIAAIGTLIRRERFDVVHAHASLFSPVAFAGVRAGIGASLPTVVTFHSMLRLSSIGLGASDALLGWTRHVVLSAVSSVVAAQAARWIPGASVAVLPNAIDESFWRSPPPPESATVHFVSAMRLTRKKRAPALVRAFASAVRFSAGVPHLTLTIAGDGPDRQSVARLAADLGVAERVSLPGYLDRPALRALYARANAFVLPSERESFGIAALEARAAGLPVLAMLDGGARDFIVPGQNGLLARDHTELARFIASLAIDTPLRRFIAARNRGTRSGFDWSDIAPLHRRLYDATAESLASAGRPSHAMPGSARAVK